MVKKNSQMIVDIVDTEFPNKGIGFFDENKITVKNTIPEQKVLIKVKKKKRKYEGKLIEILQNAAYEILPECEVFLNCGGCTYQNITYQKELEIKQKNVLKLLSQLNLENCKFLDIIASPVINNYRNKMEFSFGDTGKDGDLCLGMRKINSYYEVVDASKCSICSSDMNSILKCVKNFFEENNETFYHKLKKTGTLRHLLVRQTSFTNQILVSIVTTDKVKANLNLLKDKLLSLNLKGKIVGISHIINNSIADVIKVDEFINLFGQDYFYEEILNLKFKISLFSFFQTNSIGAQVLYSVVRNFAKESKNKVIFDLYCGTGTIAQILSDSADKVVGIEIIKEAVFAAKENAKLNNINNCEFIAGDVLKEIDSINVKPDLIVLDPPREGLHPKVIDKIIRFNANRIIYVSCKPSSLVKDLQIFKNNGYNILKVQCVDMFPRTFHVETVVLLSRVDK